MSEPIRETLPDVYFDDIYAVHDDPWGFETSPYEAAKYDRTLAALRPHYSAALEIGCSIGVLTARLAPRCGALLALDVAERALDKARARNAGFPQVRFERRRMPQEFPAGTFDLILMSEVGYYLGLADLQATLERAVGALNPGGQLLAVHWTPPVHDYPLTGDQVHEQILSTPGLARRHAERHEHYRLDLMERSG